jgi:hypothetical protein
VNLVQRIQDILLRPKTTWPEIDREAASPAGLYTNYLMILAAIPAIASFIGLSIVGVGALGVSFRVPFFSGLVNMVVGYVLSLVMVFVLSLIVDALAPTFKGQKNSLAALKLVVFAATAGMLGGIFSILPALSVLGLLAALYTIYLIYLGLPVLMKCPEDKAVAYTATVVVCGIVLGLVVGALSALTLPGGGMAGMGGMVGSGSGGKGGDVSISVPGTEIKVDTAAIEAMGKKMEEAGKKMEQAQKSGDSAAAGQAMGELMGALGGGAGAPLPAADLKALLPESLGGLARTEIESSGGQVAGLAGSSAKARYAAGDKQLELSITDLGGLGAIAASGMIGVESDRETADKVERTYKQGKRTLKEEARKDGSQSEFTVMLANGVMVEATGRQIDLGTVKGLVNGLALDQLEAKQRPAKP